MSRKIGNQAEQLAINYLKKLGYKIIANNITYAFGEIDIIAEDLANKTKPELVFVEVKHRKNLSFGQPYEAVTCAKQKKIVRAAQAYLQRIKGPLPWCRFDVISLLGDLSDAKNPNNIKIDHIKNAFDESGY